MDRSRSAEAARARLSGFLVLLLTAVALLAGGTLLRPDVSGRAAIQTRPLPPAIGDCVLIVGDGVAEIPCTEPHSGEVVMTWTPGREPAHRNQPATPRLTVSVSRLLPEQASARVCRDWTDDYIGWTDHLRRTSGEFWVVPRPLVRSALVAAPTGVPPDDRWIACIVRTAAERYTGTLRGATTSAQPSRPGGVSVCLSPTPKSVAFPDCGEPHTGELMGSVRLTQLMMRNDTVLVEHTADQIHQLCVDLVRERTGAPDPTFGGRLAIATESVWQLGLRTTELLPPAWVIPDCLVRVAGPGSLTGSLVGIGNAEPPLRSG